MNHFIKRLLVGALLLLGASSVAWTQSAPYLTSMRTTYITSDFGGAEVIQPGQISTNVGHAGFSFTIKITEAGYGNNPIAKLNGITMTQIAIEPVPATGIVTGFTRTFLYSGAYLSGGTFTYQNTSTNSPWNTMYASPLSILPYNQSTNPIFSANNTQSLSSSYGESIIGHMIRGVPPQTVTYQFLLTDTGGSAITWSLETSTGGGVSGNITISSMGLLTWDGTETGPFVQSSTCPYPYIANLNIVARNASGMMSKWPLTLNVNILPYPVCAPPPGGGGPQ